MLYTFWETWLTHNYVQYLSATGPKSFSLPIGHIPAHNLGSLNHQVVLNFNKNKEFITHSVSIFQAFDFKTDIYFHNLQQHTYQSTPTANGAHRLPCHLKITIQTFKLSAPSTLFSNASTQRVQLCTIHKYTQKSIIPPSKLLQHRICSHLIVHQHATHKVKIKRYITFLLQVKYSYCWRQWYTKHVMCACSRKPSKSFQKKWMKKFPHTAHTRTYELHQ